MRDESIFANYGSINNSIPEGFDQVYYDKTADEYHSMYEDYMPVNKDSRILDIGCGKGYFLYYLCKRGYSNFLGIDADPSSIEHSQKYITNKCELIYAEEYLSDKSDVFDLVVMNEVLEHIPKKEIIPLLKKIRRSLIAGGILICYVPNMENPFSSYTRYHDFTHTIGFTQNSLRMVMNASGFSKTEVKVPERAKKSFKQNIKSGLRQIVKKILILLFEYPPHGIIHTSRIFSVAKK
jgi:2-polyprenyl-3-methyl-5-hydroxy-6-metoxy-1,4-benzoquinol methylase